MTYSIGTTGGGGIFVNTDRFYPMPAVYVRESGDDVIIRRVSDNHILAKGDYTKYLNGDNSNATFASKAALITYLDTVFAVYVPEDEGA